MGLIPMDQPRGTGGETVDEDVNSSPLLERSKHLIRSAIERIPSGQTFLQWFDTRGQDKPQSRIHTDGFADNVVAPPECPTVSDLPARTRPFTYPTRNHTENNTVDLIAVESDDQLTVRHPDNPDAKITSDSWAPVEQ